jgi:uncharacterized protein YdeI (YjbR/CyaY-like superfamily)
VSERPARPGDATVAFVDQAQFESWLEANHATTAGVWLQLAKKGSGQPSVSYEQAVEAALCFGWIDGQKAGGDDRYWLQRFTPRSSRSRWSRINREKAERLIAAGRIRPAGLAQVQRAKADGRWERAYAGQRSVEIPPELRRGLDDDQRAARAFASLNASSRYSIIWRINDAKRPETRARRIAKYLQMLSSGDTPP